MKNYIPIKPCPFCGSKAAIYVNGGVRIVCENKNCSIGTPSLTDKNFDPKDSKALEIVVTIWNKRQEEDINE